MDARAVLSDSRYVVPPVPGGAPRGTLAWLRSHVCRFSNGEAHARRRALAVREIEALDVAALERGSSEPVAVLCAAMGLPAEAADLVSVVARSYQPGSAAEDDADR